MRLRISTPVKYGHVQVLLSIESSLPRKNPGPPNRPTWVIEPLRVHTTNGISIGLAVTNTQTNADRPRYPGNVAIGRILCYALR